MGDGQSEDQHHDASSVDRQLKQRICQGKPSYRTILMPFIIFFLAGRLVSADDNAQEQQQRNHRRNIQIETISASGKKVVRQAVLTEANGNHENNNNQKGPAKKLFGSLWSSLVESVGGVAISSQAAKGSGSDQTLAYQPRNGAKQASSATNQQIAQDPKEVISYRRKLLQQSLEQHYYDSAESIPTSVDSSTTDQEDDKQYHHLLDTTHLPLEVRKQLPHRYVKAHNVSTIINEHNKHNNDGQDHDDVYCYYYSPKPTDHWTYRWCPNFVIHQGVRTKTGEFEVQFTLGSFIRDDITDTADQSQAGQVEDQHQILHREYPDADMIDSYTQGDRCDTGGQPRMATFIVHTPGTTERCPRVVSEALKLPLIESIEEPTTCQYIVHLCPPISFINEAQIEPPPNNGNNSPEHLENIEQTIHAYMHKSHVGHFHSSHPDRITALQMGVMPPMPQSKILANKALVKSMFQHAYDSYMYNAYPAPEIKPITCKSTVFDLIRLPALTLIDSLDTLILMSNFTEFARSVERLRGLDEYHIESNKGDDRKYGRGGIFAFNENVSVFETTIRVLGGLLSAHQLAEAYVTNRVRETEVFDMETGEPLVNAPGYQTYEICDDDEHDDMHHAGELSEDIVSATQESSDVSSECQNTNEARKQNQKCRNVTSAFWAYDGFLLELAHDIGDRIYPVFETKTGIPYGTVNLISGIPLGETPIASLAGGGTLSLEMELLSRLTGDEKYGRAAKLSTRALWMRRSNLNLYGKHICTKTGRWTESLSGIGSNSDSFLEYLIKHHTLFPEDEDFWPLMHAAYGAVHNHSRLGEWYPDVDMTTGTSNGGGQKIFEALMAFYPGMQVLLGELEPAARSLNSFFLAREFLGFLPERFNFEKWVVPGTGGEHFLRPELLESAYFLHLSTKDVDHISHGGTSSWQWASDFALHALEKSTRCDCGYASVTGVSPTTTGFMNTAGKVKLKDDMPSFFLSETLKYLYLTFDADNMLHTDADREWIFTTEAHPIHNVPKSDQQERRSRMQSTAKSLKERLQKKLEGGDTPPTKFLSLRDEEWSESSTVFTFFDQFQTALDEITNSVFEKLVQRKSSITNTGMLPSFHEEPKLLCTFLSSHEVYADHDAFGETRRGKNVAHVGFTKQGRGSRLDPVCPNYHSSDLLWTRALNGGVLDYGDTYMSTMNDEDGEPTTKQLMLGSAESLVALLSGRHVVNVFGGSESCPIKEKEAEVASPSTVEQAEQSNGITRFDLGPDLGSFDVSAFPGGNGFSIQKVETGDTITSNLLEENDPEEIGKVEHYALIDSKLQPINAMNSEAPETVDEQKGALPERTAAIANLHGDVYFCRVEIVLEKSDKVDEVAGAIDGEHAPNEEEEEEEDDSETLVATYPCAPAMFGPTNMRNLVKQDGLLVELPLLPPLKGQEYGCMATEDPKGENAIFDTKVEHVEDESHVGDDGVSEEDDDEEEEEEDDAICANKVVQMVRRGGCTFQDKVVKYLETAGAVIVINSDDENLFAMSGGAGKISAGQPLEDNFHYPPAVIITGSDGEEMVRLVEEFAANHEPSETLLARVSLTSQNAELKAVGKSYTVERTEHWPVVKASREAIQVFSKAGWGVHAVQHKNNGNLEWQLYVVRHGDVEDDA